MAQLPLRPYHNILDVGCGSGHLTIPLAKFLFDGKVYAMDSTTSNLNDLKERLVKARLSNVVPVTTKKQQQAIGSESLDGALLPFTLHIAEGKEAYLQEFLPYLKRGAWVAVLEWQKHGEHGGPPESQRLEETEVIAMAERAGLRISGRRTLTEDYYLVLLRK
jgi:ubiquinone/menaquinone biosynthesis C-methylase UbiE